MVEVTAETLYEAVALGMAAIRTDEWVTGIAQGLNAVRVRVTNVVVEHEVRIMAFTKGWRPTPRNDGSQTHSVDSRHGDAERERVINSAWDSDRAILG